MVTAPGAGGSLVGTAVAHYRITSRLGSGGMGVVYEAEDTKLGRRVALKFLPAEMAQDAPALERFQREARAASALNHPGICTVYAIDQHEGQHFIAMELLEGETLAERIRKGALELADAARAGHPDRRRARVGARQGHRPPRPEAREHLRDAARAGQGARLRPRRRSSRSRPTGGEHSEAPTAVQQHELTSAGTTMGTVSYMSPEQARGQLTDARTDLFSLGTVLYQMATGVLPFQGDTSADVVSRPSSTGAAAGHAAQPVAAGRARPDPVEGAREGPQPALPDGDRAQDRSLAPQARRRLGRPACGRARGPDERPAEGRALRRRPLLREPLGREGGRVPARRRDRGHHHRAVEDQGPQGALAADGAAVPRQAGRDGAGRPAAQGDLVLAGSIRRGGNRLRITAQLVDAETDSLLWSERYDREMADVFEVQDEIARKIAPRCASRCRRRSRRRSRRGRPRTCRPTTSTCAARATRGG